MTRLIPTTLFVFITIILVIARPSSAGTWPIFDDFEDGDARDASPVTWSSDPDLPERQRITGTVENGDFVVSSTGAVQGPGAEALYGITETLDEVTAGARDVVASTTLRIKSFGQFAFPAIWVRGKPGDTAYWGGINSAGVVALGETNNGSASDIRVDTSIDPVQNDVTIELSAIDDILSLRVWESGTPRPELPLLERQDDTIDRGSIGLFVNANGPFEVAFREFSAVPEPTTITLLVFTLIGLMFSRVNRVR